LFQEQMLQMAMVIADFSGDEAEELRRALSYHRSDERMQSAAARLRSAMHRKNVKPEIAERIVKAVGSFALYGFPESHAISFALLAYASAYLKVHRAPEFFAALLNNQPMGFYSAATLVKDAKRHGVQVRPVCVARSQWECLIEADNSIRLGLRQVQGLRQESVLGMIAERRRQPFASLDDFKARTRFSKEDERTLAGIGALNCFAAHRRAALWQVERIARPDELLAGNQMDAEPPSSPLAPMNPMERVQADYTGLRLTTGPHPMALIRPALAGIWRAADLAQGRNGQLVQIAGQVICRQRPGTAKGICFISLEDETGISNAIVSPELFESERLKITAEWFLQIEGILQNRENTIHVKARKIERLDYSDLKTASSHDFG
jgi:error-prone DNA polymerase